MAYAPTVLELSGQLATAEAAFDREKTGSPKAGDLICQEPGCDERCDECRLECSIMSAIVETLRRDLVKAIGMAAPTIAHGGRYFVATQGRA